MAQPAHFSNQPGTQSSNWPSTRPGSQPGTQADSKASGQGASLVRRSDRFSLPGPGWIWWALLIALLLPFAYAFGFLFPRGDDFDEVTRAMFPFDLPGGLYEIVREWLTWSGRFTYHFLAVFFGKAGEIRPLYGLVCAAVAALYGLGLYGLARVVNVRRGPAAFCALLAVLVVLACHQSLPNLYLLTDALTMGLLQAMTLVFLWMLCRLWSAPAATAQKARRQAIIVGVLTVGVFEHSALAALTACTVAVLLALAQRFAARESEPDGTQTARARLRHMGILWLWILGALLFSFLALGNQVRRATRHISADVQLRQLAGAFDEWLNAAFCIFDGLWPWAVLLLVLLLRGLRNGSNAADQAQTGSLPSGPRSGLLLAALAILAYLGLSALLTVLHALSDVSITSSAKLPAGLTVFAAYACGFALWGLLDALPAVERALARLPQQGLMIMLLIPLLTMLASSANWRTTTVNAANGSMLHLGQQLQERYDSLRAIGSAAQPPNAPPRFGLLGEIYRPGARKRAIATSLPLPAVQSSLPETVFPVQMGEALPPQPETWPNLWAAWMLGLGGVYSTPPAPSAAIAILQAPAELAAQRPLHLVVPQALQNTGIEAAWLVRANGVPPQYLLSAATSTFNDFWLVLHGQDLSRIERIAVLRLNQTDWRRLMPVFLQRQAAAQILEQQNLTAAFAAGGLASAYMRIVAALATEPLQYAAAAWRQGEYLAVPVSQAVHAPLGLFVGLNDGPLLRLDLSKP